MGRAHHLQIASSQRFPTTIPGSQTNQNYGVSNADHGEFTARTWNGGQNLYPAAGFPPGSEQRFMAPQPNGAIHVPTSLGIHPGSGQRFANPTVASMRFTAPIQQTHQVAPVIYATSTQQQSYPTAPVRYAAPVRRPYPVQQSPIVLQPTMDEAWNVLPNTEVQFPSPKPRLNTGYVSSSNQDNSVDSWIDALDPGRVSDDRNWSQAGIGPNVMMSWLVHQYLPKVQLPMFDGSAAEWVEFIIKFRDIVHNQQYLNDVQRHQLLVQHLEDEAKRSVKGFNNDTRGYVMSLKRIKHLFGQKPMVARAVLGKVTKGKALQNEDVKGLTQFYYDIGDCLTTLRQLNYVSDLYSSDTLQQAVQRLPSKMVWKWADRSIVIRESEEPNLLHLEKWLERRVMAMKESCVLESRGQYRPTNKPKEEKFNAKVNMFDLKCQLCQESHGIWKCPRYLELNPFRRMEKARRYKLCFNCFNEGHAIEACESRKTCFTSGCNEKHHTTLHEYFMERGRIRKGFEEKETGQKDQADLDKVAEQKRKEDQKTVVEQKRLEKELAEKKKLEAAKKDEKATVEREVEDNTFNGVLAKKKKDVMLQIVPVM